MIKLGLLFLIAIFSAVAAIPALAELFEKRNWPGKGWTPGKPPVGAPGPVAGAGLGFLAAGGIYLVHRYRKQKADAVKRELDAQASE